MNLLNLGKFLPTWFSTLLRSSQNLKSVFILLSLKLHHQEICELYYLSSTLIVTTLVYSIPSSPVCFANKFLIGFLASSLLPIASSTLREPNILVHASAHTAPVYNPTRTSTPVSQSQSTSISSEALLLSPLPRPDQFCSLKVAGMPAPQPDKCSHLLRLHTTTPKSGLFWWLPISNCDPPTTATLFSLAFIFSIWLFLLVSHPLASMCYSVYEQLFSMRIHENKELCAGPVHAYYTDGLHSNYLMNKLDK